MIRLAVAPDLPVLRGLERACFGAEAWSDGLLAAEVEAGTRVVLVLEDDGRPVAYGTVGVVADVADLHRIATDPQAQGRGHGRALLAALLAAAAERGAERMLLEVADDNAAARHLYDTSGFATIARRRGYYAGGVDALVMERALP